MVIFYATHCTVIVQIKSTSLLISMTEDIKYELHVINTTIKCRKKNGGTLQQFTKMVQFHSSVKQLSIYNVYYTFTWLKFYIYQMLFILKQQQPF